MMQMCANAQERSRDDWESLLSAADKRFEIEAISTPPHSALSVIQVVFRDDMMNDGGLEVRSLPDTESDLDIGNDSFSTADLDSSSESECNYIHTSMPAAAEPEDRQDWRPEAFASHSSIARGYAPFEYQDQDDGHAWRLHGTRATQEDRTTARSGVDEWALLRCENFFL